MFQRCWRFLAYDLGLALQIMIPTRSQQTQSFVQLLAHGARSFTCRRTSASLTVSTSNFTRHCSLSMKFSNHYIVYSCAYHKKLLNQGWMYLSVSYLCFYSFVLGTETKVVIELKDIEELSKEKSKRGVFSDAIRIVTRNKTEVMVFSRSPILLM